MDGQESDAADAAEAAPHDSTWNKRVMAKPSSDRSATKKQRVRPDEDGAPTRTPGEEAATPPSAPAPAPYPAVPLPTPPASLAIAPVYGFPAADARGRLRVAVQVSGYPLRWITEETDESERTVIAPAVGDAATSLWLTMDQVVEAVSGIEGVPAIPGHASINLVRGQMFSAALPPTVTKPVTPLTSVVHNLYRVEFVHTLMNYITFNPEEDPLCRDMFFRVVVAAPELVENDDDVEITPGIACMRSHHASLTLITDHDAMQALGPDYRTGFVCDICALTRDKVSQYSVLLRCKACEMDFCANCWGGDLPGFD